MSAVALWPEGMPSYFVDMNSETVERVIGVVADSQGNYFWVLADADGKGCIMSDADDMAATGNSLFSTKEAAESELKRQTTVEEAA